MHSLVARILWSVAQVLIVLLLMVKISFQPHGVHSRRVEFKWAGKKEKAPNRTTEQELEADKARLEAAPDEDIFKQHYRGNVRFRTKLFEGC